MNDLVLLGKALSDPTRVRILAALRVGEVCVCELVQALEMSQSTLSSHLQIIRQAGLVSTRKCGKWIYYDLEESQVALIDAVFAAHKSAMKADRRLARDARRLHERLSLRENGCCVVGFAASASATSSTRL